MEKETVDNGRQEEEELRREISDDSTNSRQMGAVSVSKKSCPVQGDYQCASSECFHIPSQYYVTVVKLIAPVSLSVCAFSHNYSEYTRKIHIRSI